MDTQLSKSIEHEFTSKIMEWYQQNKRDFPWRNSRDPYSVWISETLLQQTDVAKVLPAYIEIISKFPKITDLNKAPIKDLDGIFLKIGLRYKAERIIKATNQIYSEYGGIFPNTKDELLKIIGIGEYIASALASFAFNENCAVVDTNVIRILSRVFNITSNKSRPRNDKLIWQFANRLIDQDNPRDYNYAVLDFSALICRARIPICGRCPMIYICNYFEDYLERI